MSARTWPATLAIAAVLALGAAAAPQSAAARAAAVAPAGDTQAQANEIAEIMFGIIDLRALITQGFQEGMAGDDVFSFRPEWKGLLTEAAVEEFDHDRPVLIGIFGRMLSQNLTPEEIRVGLIMMRDPAVQKDFADGAAGRPVDSKAPNYGREYRKAAATPAGASFIRKLDSMDTFSGATQKEMIIELLPGIMRRFGEKAEALEAGRRAG
ncbi:hypothetical protein QO010_002967 [Caulobacter ginsengisoli]|uniref:DUF2059 domain-containing protein n=1 Tax=Caulobacter ginsengisoli TaxID=400775 RepID=A0ABU0IT51_9CAUL|nr:hypothetical protein [Caulobacter ginsengisoli]MDQ0465183.1 hypothetical protein [Caulobacter ginsengisoli]